MRKGTILAIVVFAGLLAAVVAMNRRAPERGIARLSFAVDKDKVDLLEIKGPNPMKLERKSGKWTLGDGKPAEENAVRSALDALAKIDSSDVVTSNPDRFAELDVNDEKGTRVRAAAQGRTVAEFVIGKPGGGGANVRKGDNVWTVKGLWPAVFSKSASAWHDLHVFTEKPEEVTRVEVTPASGAAWALEKKDEKWALTDEKAVPKGFRFDENAARSFASTLVGLSAHELLDKDPGDEVSGLSAADRFAFVLKDGTRRELRLGKARADKSVHVGVEGRAEVWTLAEWTARNLKKSPLDLRELTLVRMDRTKVRRLTIQNGKEKLVLEKQGADWKIGTCTEKIPDGFELDSSLVERRLGTLSSARAMRPADIASAKAGVDRPSGSVTASLDGGDSAGLVFGAQTKDDTNEVFVVRGNIDRDLYYASKWMHDDLLGGLASFRKQAAPQQPSGLEGLSPDVRAKLMEQLRRQQ